MYDVLVTLGSTTYPLASGNVMVIIQYQANPKYS